MKDLEGRASERVGAPPERCLALLGDVDGYPRWYPEVVREVEVLERAPDGPASRVRAALHVAVGPISRDLPLTLDVQREAAAVRLVRVARGHSDAERFSVDWRVAADGGGASGSRIDLALDAVLDLPRFVPLPPGVGETVARGFVAAAARELAR